jgi:putative redox protein
MQKLSDDTSAAPPRRPSHVRSEWLGDHRFDSGHPGIPTAHIDGESVTGQSPPDALLTALATCSGVDVVDILGKRRTPVERMSIDVEGHRRAAFPRRFEHIKLTFALYGKGIERVHAERAVHLAFEKYCTVAASLAPDIVLEAMVVLNGESGSFIRQPNFVP